jgi:hypothetical protein
MKGKKIEKNENKKIYLELILAVIIISTFIYSISFLTYANSANLFK